MLDIGAWHHLFKTVPPLAVEGWTTGNYLSRTDTTLTNEVLVLFSWFLTDANPSAIACLLGLGDSGADLGRFAVRVTTSLTVSATKSDDAGGGSESLTAGTTPLNRWNQALAVFTSNTSRQAILNTVKATVDTINVADPTINFQSIGILLRATALQPATNSRIAGAMVLNALPSTAALARVFFGGEHPCLVFDPATILRAWLFYPGFPMGFDFSTAGAHMDVTGTGLRFASGPPVHLLARQPRLFRSSSAMGVSTVSATDTLFLFDLRLADLRGTRPDDVFVQDEVTKQVRQVRDEGLFLDETTARRTYRITEDFLLLLETSTAQKISPDGTLTTVTLTDYMLLGEELQKTVRGIRDETMFLVETALGQKVTGSTLSEGLFLHDDVVRVLRAVRDDSAAFGEDLVKMVRTVRDDTLFTLETSLDQRIRAASATDGLFLSDSTAKVAQMMVAEQLLLLDEPIKRLRRVFDADTMFLYDALVSSYLQVGAEALIFVRLKLLGIAYNEIALVSDWVGEKIALRGALFSELQLFDTG